MRLSIDEGYPRRRMRLKTYRSGRQSKTSPRYALSRNGNGVHRQEKNSLTYARRTASMTRHPPEQLTSLPDVHAHETRLSLCGTFPNSLLNICTEYVIQTVTRPQTKAQYTHEISVPCHDTLLTRAQMRILRHDTPPTTTLTGAPKARFMSRHRLP